MSAAIYSSPVDKLLTLGKPESVLPEKWPNYLELGLGPEHIPELIRMAIDPEFRGPEAEVESELSSRMTNGCLKNCHQSSG